jgi:hypothetical protein
LGFLTKFDEKAKKPKIAFWCFWRKWQKPTFFAIFAEIGFTNFVKER